MLPREHPAIAGCESAQTTHRPSSAWPGPPASCSRYGRSPDMPPACASSSRVALPTSWPPPPWPRLSACCGTRRVLPAKSLIQPHRRSAPPLPPLAHKAVILIADRAQPLLAARGVLARISTGIRNGGEWGLRQSFGQLVTPMSLPTATCWQPTMGP